MSRPDDRVALEAVMSKRRFHRRIGLPSAHPPVPAGASIDNVLTSTIDEPDLEVPPGEDAVASTPPAPPTAALPGDSEPVRHAPDDPDKQFRAKPDDYYPTEDRAKAQKLNADHP